MFIDAHLKPPFSQIPEIRRDIFGAGMAHWTVYWVQTGREGQLVFGIDYSREKVLMEQASNLKTICLKVIQTFQQQR